MFFGGGLAGLVVLFLFVYAIVDVISTDEALMRNLPKLVWLLVVIFVPLVGSIAWLLLGRPEHAGFRPGDTNPRSPSPRRVVGPEDSPEFIAGLNEDTDRLRRWEEDLRRREEEMRRREQGDA